MSSIGVRRCRTNSYAIGSDAHSRVTHAAEDPVRESRRQRFHARSRKAAELQVLAIAKRRHLLRTELEVEIPGPPACRQALQPLLLFRRGCGFRLLAQLLRRLVQILSQLPHLVVERY